MNAKEEVLGQLSKLVEEGNRLGSTFTLNGMGGYASAEPEVNLRAFVTSALACIARVAGKESDYYRQIPSRRDGPLGVPGFDPSFVPAVTGCLVSLRDAVENDLLASLADRIRSRLHDDLLQQGTELLHAKYHVAAMVLVGAVLENHLRRLVEKSGTSATGNGSISKYNGVLKAKAYATTTWRRIQAIGDLRNEAAHGNSLAVKPEEVQESLAYVRRFLVDHE